jgi:outer membrane protein assembly factor BamB
MNLKLKIIIIFIFVLGFAYAGNETNHTIEAGNLKWSFITKDYVTSSPAVYNDTVYIGSADGNLYALNYLGGGMRWSYQTGGKIESSPVVHEGIVYFGSNDNRFYALDASNGTQIWNYSTGGKIYSTPLIANSMVYLTSGDGNVYALSLINRTKIWNYSTGGAIYSSPAFAYSNIYIGSSDGSIYAINAFVGAKNWELKTGGSIHSSPVVRDFVLYIGSDDRKLYAVNSFNGVSLWNFSTSNKVQSLPSLSNDSVYFSSNDGNLYSLSLEDGSKRWNISTEGQVQSSPTYDNGTRFIYFGSADQNLYATDEKGEIIWKYKMRDWILSKPAPYKGIIYTGSYDGNVYAISTITTNITPFETEALAGEVALINGSARADAGVDKVEVRIDDGDWEEALVNGNWSYVWEIDNLTEKKYKISARTIDKNGNVEIEPYRPLSILVTKNISLTLKKMFVTFPEKVNIAQPVSFIVTDGNGKPVPFPKLLIGSSAYTGNENGTIEKDASGLPIRFLMEGVVNFTIVKKGYIIQSPEKLLITVVAEPIPTVLYLLTAGEFLLIFLGVAVSYFVIKRFRKKS